MSPISYAKRDLYFILFCKIVPPCHLPCEREFFKVRWVKHLHIPRTLRPFFFVLLGRKVDIVNFCMYSGSICQIFSCMPGSMI